jgi:hypothetical protein
LAIARGRPPPFFELGFSGGGGLHSGSTPADFAGDAEGETPADADADGDRDPEATGDGLAPVHAPARNRTVRKPDSARRVTAEGSPSWTGRHRDDGEDDRSSREPDRGQGGDLASRGVLAQGNRHRRSQEQQERDHV